MDFWIKLYVKYGMDKINFTKYFSNCNQEEYMQDTTKCLHEIHREGLVSIYGKNNIMIQFTQKFIDEVINESTDSRIN